MNRSISFSVMAAISFAPLSAFAAIYNHFSYEYVAAEDPPALCENQTASEISGRLLWDPVNREYTTDQYATNEFHLSGIKEFKIDIDSAITKDDTSSQDFANSWEQDISYSIHIDDNLGIRRLLDNIHPDDVYSDTFSLQDTGVSQVVVSKKDDSKMTGVFDVYLSNVVKPAFPFEPLRGETYRQTITFVCFMD